MNTNIVLDNENSKALFSLEESKSFYRISVDLPAISEKTEIVKHRNELLPKTQRKGSYL